MAIDAVVERLGGREREARHREGRARASIHAGEALERCVRFRTAVADDNVVDG